jgi:hypothetical protein
MCETIYKDEQFTHVLFINKQKQLLFNNFLFVQRRVRSFARKSYAGPEYSFGYYLFCTTRKRAHFIYTYS